MLRTVAVVIILLKVSLANGQETDLASLKERLSIVNVDSQYVDVLNEIAFKMISTDPIVAKDDVNISLTKAKEIDYQRGIARALTIYGGVFWSFGNYDKALSYYLEALKSYQKLDDTIGRSDVLNNIGEVYKKLGEYNNALDYLKHSASLKEGMDIRPALTYNNIAEVYLQTEEFELAKEYYNKAFIIAMQTEDERTLAYVSDGIGMMHLLKGDYENAIVHLHDAVGVRQELNDIRGLSYSYSNMGKAFFGLGKYDSAGFYYEMGMQAALASNAGDVKMELYKRLSRLDSAKGDMTAAYNYYLKHDLLKDSLFNEEKSGQIARMQAEYENELLRSDNQMKQVELDQRNTFIIMVTMLLIMSFALVWVLFKQRSDQKEVNKELQDKNRFIARQHSEIQSQAIKLEELNDNLENLNENLENKIKKRTELLESQNVELAQYAFIHAHELRAPVANILGLIELLKHNDLPTDAEEIVSHLYTATAQLDEVICKIAEREVENAI